MMQGIIQMMFQLDGVFLSILENINRQANDICNLLFKETTSFVQGLLYETTMDFIRTDVAMITNWIALIESLV